MLTRSNAIWPNGNDILTAAICNELPEGCATQPKVKIVDRQFDRMTYHLQAVHYFAELVLW